jgi:hypothetical protein
MVETLLQNMIMLTLLGGDHSARCFRAVVKLIFRKMNNPDIPTSTVTLRVGHIDAAKDTYKFYRRPLHIS